MNEKHVIALNEQELQRIWTGPMDYPIPYKTMMAMVTDKNQRERRKEQQEAVMRRYRLCCSSPSSSTLFFFKLQKLFEAER